MFMMLSSLAIGFVIVYAFPLMLFKIILYLIIESMPIIRLRMQELCFGSLAVSITESALLRILSLKKSFRFQWQKELKVREGGQLFVLLQLKTDRSIKIAWEGGLHD